MDPALHEACQVEEMAELRDLSREAADRGIVACRMLGKFPNLREGDALAPGCPTPLDHLTRFAEFSR
jgi:hypothetical protein